MSARDELLEGIEKLSSSARRRVAASSRKRSPFKFVVVQTRACGILQTAAWPTASKLNLSSMQRPSSASAEKFLKYRRSGSVSCVVAAMHMPGISGLAVCHLSKPFAAEEMFECIRLALDLRKLP